MVATARSISDYTLDPARGAARCLEESLVVVWVRWGRIPYSEGQGDGAEEQGEGMERSFGIGSMMVAGDDRQHILRPPA